MRRARVDGQNVATVRSSRAGLQKERSSKEIHTDLPGADLATLEFQNTVAVQGRLVQAIRRSRPRKKRLVKIHI